MRYPMIVGGLAIAFAMVLRPAPARATGGGDCSGADDWSDSCPYWCSALADACDLYSDANHNTGPHYTCTESVSSHWENKAYLDNHECAVA